MGCYASDRNANELSARLHWAGWGRSNMNLSNNLRNCTIYVRLGLSLAATAGLVTIAHAQVNSAPDVPSAIQTPVGQRVIWRAHAAGVQIYVCQVGSDGKAQWALKPRKPSCATTKAP